MNERERAVRLALDLLREHGPLTTGALLNLMPDWWHDRLTDNPGQWLTAQRAWREMAWRNAKTKEWHAVLPTTGRDMATATTGGGGHGD
jgi:hypothetical protein